MKLIALWVFVEDEDTGIGDWAKAFFGRFDLVLLKNTIDRAAVGDNHNGLICVLSMKMLHKNGDSSRHLSHRLATVFVPNQVFVVTSLLKLLPKLVFCWISLALPYPACKYSHVALAQCR